MARDKGKTLSGGRFMTPRFRINYPHLCTRISADAEFDANRYTCQAVWDTDQVDLSLLEKLISDCALSAGHKRGYKSPLRDDHDYDESCVFANIKYYAQRGRPVVIWGDKTPVESDDEIIPGSYARAIVSAYAYDQRGNKGVLLSIESVQCLGGGTRFVGGAAAAVAKRAEEEFGEEEVYDTAEPDMDDDDDNL